MPLFFSRAKETVLRASEECDVPSITLTGQPGQEQFQLQVGESRGRSTAANKFEQVRDILPSRTTRPINWGSAFALALAALPFIALTLLFALDPYSRNYTLGLVADYGGKKQDAVAYYSAALSSRQDAFALRSRADCYAELGESELERADLQSLLNSTALTPGRKLGLYPRLINLNFALGDAKTANLCKAYANESRTSSGKAEAAYMLLLMGRTADAVSVAESILPSKDDASQEKTIVEALLSREAGDSKHAMQMISAVKDRHADVFKDSRLCYDEESVPAALRALIHLDNKEILAARNDIQKALSLRKRADKSEPIVDVLNGWLLLEEGRLDECLRVANEVYDSPDIEDSMLGANIEAAILLMRKNVYLSQHLADKAAEQEQLYKKALVSGSLLTPRPFKP